MDNIDPTPNPSVPDYAIATARARWRDRLKEQGLPAAAAEVIADATVDPAQARRDLDHPVRKRLPVGDVYLVNTEVWTPAVLPSLTNPRPGVERSWPAGGPATPPLEQPTAVGPEPFLHLDAPGGLTQLVDVDAANRKHLMAKNGSWKTSIETIGVLEPIWAVPTLITIHEPGIPARETWALISLEGSTRTTLAQAGLGHLGGFAGLAEILTRSSNRLRVFTKWCNGNGSKATENWGDATDKHRRLATLPALVPIRFVPREATVANFAVAASSLVATAHMETPTPWEAGAEFGELGSSVLAELARLQLITEDAEAWLAGRLSPEEALHRGFSARAPDRAAKLLGLFTTRDQRVHDVIRQTVTAHTSRKKVDGDYKAKIAAELIARSFRDEDRKTRARKRTYLAKAAPKAVIEGEFTADHTVDVCILRDKALRELAAGETRGPALGELAARAWTAAVDAEVLYGQRGFGEVASDYREAGNVIDTMVKSPHGVRQLTRIVEDHAAGSAPILVDVHGHVLVSEDGTIPLEANNTQLRRRFDEAGSVLGNPSDTDDDPEAKLGYAMSKVFQGISNLENAIGAAEAVLNHHGDRLLVEEGYPEIRTRPAVEVLEVICRKLDRWGTTNTIRHGAYDPTEDGVPGRVLDSDDLEDNDEGEPAA